MTSKGNGVIGIRREDKNKWERRTALCPCHVEELVKDGVKVLVQPSNSRIFANNEYVKAGAELRDDLSEAETIFAVKEVPIERLIPNKSYVFFSHTIKAQEENMPLLDAMMEKNIRMFDYEKITAGGDAKAPRLVAFGIYAGYAGMIDYIRGLGERLLAMGYSTPFLHCGSAFMYKDLEHARQAVSTVGAEISRIGVPEDLSPMTFVFTGTGRVAQGALEIFRHLPCEYVEPSKLKDLAEGKVPSKTTVLYYTIADSKDMAVHKGGKPFDKKDYYANPKDYEGVFHENILPYTHNLINCMYWDPRFPRLVSIEQGRQLKRAGRLPLIGVCDITCDRAGSIEHLSKFSNIEDPFYLVDFETGKAREDSSLDHDGVLYHAVDHLPTETAKEASMHFGEKLLPFVKELALSDASVPFAEQTDIPPELKGSCITCHGKLTPNFEYIQRMREVNERKATGSKKRDASGGLKRNMSFAAIKLAGHLFDKKIINQALDIIEEHRGAFNILNWDVGQNANSTSKVTVQVHAKSPNALADIVESMKSIDGLVKEESDLNL